MDFMPFKAAVAKQFKRMQEHQLFRVAIDNEKLYETYLSAFPAGTNELYRERTEHDCSCCRHFIRDLGNVIAIIDGKTETIWDIDTRGVDVGYAVVAEAMRASVTRQPIEDTFLHFEKTVGTDKNIEDILGKTKVWEHFHVNLKPQYVLPAVNIPTELGKVRETAQVFKRGLIELTIDSIDTVLDLISQNSLYRGEEHTFALTEFRKLKKEFDKLPGEDQDLFTWTKSAGATQSVARIRNTAIGSLLQDLSKDVDVETAVKSFEKKVAPDSYKRTTALVTPAMIKKAKETIAELGLTSALERRYANLRDITANNILFANRDAKKVINNDVFDDMIAKATTVKPKQFDGIETVTIDDFIKNILPRSTSVKILLENRHKTNLMSLVAPVDPTAGRLFKWDNNFSWSYNGDLADSDMRKAVTARGGRVDGAFRFTHQWNYDKRNASLMDLHVFMPGNGTLPENGKHGSYGNAHRVGWNNRNHISSGGVQDVDYVQPAPVGYVPVENITFPSIGRMPEGRYICKVHNWNLRSPTNGGFKAEIEFGGQIFQYEYDKPMGHKEWVTVAEVTLTKGVFTIKHHLKEQTSSVKMYGLDSMQFHKVSLLMNSPNHWDGFTTGNRHTFFIIDGAKADELARGFYNEFLKEELMPHRKVFEIVGAKMKVADSDDQLSGLGFSSTQKTDVVLRVTGSITRTLKVTF